MRSARAFLPRLFVSHDSSTYTNGCAHEEERQRDIVWWVYAHTRGHAPFDFGALVLPWVLPCAAARVVVVLVSTISSPCVSIYAPSPTRRRACLLKAAMRTTHPSLSVPYLRSRLCVCVSSLSCSSGTEAVASEGRKVSERVSERRVRDGRKDGERAYVASPVRRAFNARQSAVTCARDASVYQSGSRDLICARGVGRREMGGRGDGSQSWYDGVRECGMER